MNKTIANSDAAHNTCKIAAWELPNLQLTRSVLSNALQRMARPSTSRNSLVKRGARMFRNGTPIGTVIIIRIEFFIGSTSSKQH
jgi:hypothetical protein